MRFLTAALFAAALYSATTGRPTLATAQEKPPVAKWEYAELSYRPTPGRPAGKDLNGNEVAATQGTVTIRWTTGAEEVSVKAWAELAQKLKVEAKEAKQGTSTSHLKVRALNALGAAGWELVSQERSSPAASVTWLFKRRVP